MTVPTFLFLSSFFALLCETMVPQGLVGFLRLSKDANPSSQTVLFGEICKQTDHTPGVGWRESVVTAVLLLFCPQASLRAVGTQTLFHNCTDLFPNYHK